MREFNVLNKEERIFGPHFLEASAGTGKTFTIEHVAVRLLIDEEKALEPESLLIVTFTREATRELKARIRRNLKAVLAQVEGKEPLFPYLEGLDLKKVKEKIEWALSSFDEITIATIHGFCFKALKEDAFSAGFSLDTPDPDAQDTDLMLFNQALEFLKSSLNPEDIAPSQLRHLMRRHGRDLDSLAKEIAHLSTFKEKDSLNFTEILAAFNQKLKEISFKIEKEKAFEDFLHLKSCYKKMTDKKYEEQALFFLKILEKGKISPEEFNSLLFDKEYFLFFLSKENEKIRKPILPPLFYPDLFSRIYQEIAPLLSFALNGFWIALSIAQIFRKKTDLITPDKLLQTMEKALQKEDFKKNLQKKYRAFIIDEFQDTDKTQWNIFSSLFLKKQGGMDALYLVGDPKQSIYSFRNADLYTYLTAKAKIGEENHFLLKTCFRSEPALIRGLNAIFSKVPHLLELPKWGTHIDYIQVKAADNAVDTIEGGALHFTLFSEEKKDIEEAVFNDIANKIIGIDSSSSIAILVKDRFQAERISLILKERKIPSTVQRKRDLRETSGFKAFSTLITSFCLDKNLRKSLLYNPLFLDNKITLDLLQELKNLFFKDTKRCLLKILEGINYSDFYEEASQTVNELLAIQEDGSAFTLLSFIEKCQTQKIALPFIPSQDNCRIQIMTIHMSKGLEFDFVFLPGLVTRHEAKEEYLYLKDEERFLLFEEDCVHSQAFIAEIEAEKMRTLYVGLTRAKKRNYIPLPISESPSKYSSCFEAFFEKMGGFSIDKLAAPEITFESYKKSTPIFYERQENDFLNEEKKYTKEFLPSPILSFTLLSSSLAISNNFSNKKEENLSLPTGAKTGVILHAIFETLFKEKKVSDRDFLRRTVFKLSKATLLQGQEENVIDLVLSNLQIDLGGFTLMDVPADQIMEEIEFLYKDKKGSFLKGFIDLVFLYRGKYYIIDWKSNMLGSEVEDYSDKKIVEAMDSANYWLQAEIYAGALRRHLVNFSTDPFESLFGGAYYFFLRGKKAYHFMPNLNEEFYAQR